MRFYKDLQVWSKAMVLAESAYAFTKFLPESEKFGLISQIQRCAVSIPSNIAEGCGRGSDKELVRFLDISRGSLNELETQIILTGKIHEIANGVILGETRDLSKMLYAFRNKLSPFAYPLEPRTE